MAFSNRIEKEKYQAQSGNLAQGMAISPDELKGCRQSLRDSVSNQKRRAEEASNQASRLGELEYLLEKNPEVARILELMEDVRR